MKNDLLILILQQSTKRHLLCVKCQNRKKERYHW